MKYHEYKQECQLHRMKEKNNNKYVYITLFKSDPQLKAGIL